MTPDVETSTLRAQQLVNLTQALTERLSAERDAFRAHRAQDVALGMAETRNWPTSIAASRPRPRPRPPS